MTTILVVLGLVAVIGFAIWLGFRGQRKRGQAEAERDQFRAKSEQARIANEIDENVAGLSDDELDRELRDGR